ncbi:hypothetical protein PRNP1_005098 [Phytophthora ramorum]
MAQPERQSEEDASPRLAHVEQAWLAAARNGDVDRMKMLRNQHPKWLDLQRNVDTLAVDSDGSRSSRTTGFCSWDGFHLGTIGASALHTATWHGDTNIGQYLLQEGQDPNTEDDTGMTPIMLAIMHHNLQATRCVFRDRLAIQRNLVTDCRHEDDERTRKTMERIQLFFRFNADVDKQCRRGKTALHQATTDDTYEVAKLLISKGANIDIQDEEGKSPLYDCIQSASMLVADLLLQHGAQIHLPDSDGVTPLQLVVRTHDVPMLQIVLNHHQLVPTQGEDFAGSVLMTAADEGALPIVRFLLEEGYTSVDHQSSIGETAMHRALTNKRAAVTEFLRAFDEQARVLLLRTRADESCLHYAARYSSPDELRRLLGFYGRWRSGADVPLLEDDDVVMSLLNDVNSGGYTALFLAATSKSEDRSAKTRLMLDAGAKLLGGSPFLEIASDRTTMTLSADVQKCLSLWLSECADSRLDVATKFCMKYLAIISSLHHLQLQVNHKVLEVLVSSGQAVDMTPLLLLLPFDRRASLLLVEHVGAFGRQQGHPLVRALYEELAAAWTGLDASP